MSRWRPICPECGYSLRGLLHSRCPECGVDLPTANRTFRRWAIQRLPWDRARRTSLLMAYLRTLLRILFVPWRAGRRVALPDRWGRAMRWAISHLLLCALAATLLSDQAVYVYWFIEWVHPSAFHHPAFYLLENAPAHRALVWLAESMLAWTVVLLSFPLVATMVSLGTPRRHRAAKLTAAKWSLYVVPVLPGTLAAWYGYYFIHPQPWQTAPPQPPLPIELLAIVYGVWWAVGLAASQYGKARWAPSALLPAFLYTCVWWALIKFLFPGGPLGGLL